MQPDFINVLCNHLLTGIIVADSDYRCVAVNTPAEQILMVSESHLIGQNVLTLLTPMIAPLEDSQEDLLVQQQIYEIQLAKQFEHTRTLYQAFLHYDCTILVNKDKHFGETVTIDYGVSPMETDDGFFYLIELWAKDRQSRIHQEQQQQAQHHVTRQLIRSMAHEVKNPLAGIMGASQLLLKTMPTALDCPSSLTNSERSSTKPQADCTVINVTGAKLQKVRNYLTIIMDETRRLNDLVNQLLGSPTLPHWQVINIHEPIEHVIALVAMQHQTINFIRDYDLSLPEIMADKDQLVQVFLNLINNAIQAIEENNIVNPTITLRTRVAYQYTIGEIRHKSVLKIDIIDNGIGIHSELLPQIFYPLVTGRANGTGLGLALVHDIIQRHQGMINVSSTPGETIFSLYLPWQQTK